MNNSSLDKQLNEYKQFVWSLVKSKYHKDYFIFLNLIDENSIKILTVLKFNSLSFNNKMTYLENIFDKYTLFFDKIFSDKKDKKYLEIDLNDKDFTIVFSLLEETTDVLRESIEEDLREIWEKEQCVRGESSDDIDYDYYEDYRNRDEKVEIRF